MKKIVKILATFLLSVPMLFAFSGNASKQSSSQEAGSVSSGVSGQTQESAKQEEFIGTGIPGDINADGAVNNTDAILLYRFVTETSATAGIDLQAIDIDGNGIFDYEDFFNLFQYVSGWTGVKIGYGYGWDYKCAHETKYVPAKAATCSEDGNVEYWLCKACGVAFADSECKTTISDANIVISAYSKHTFSDWNVISQATCEDKGIQQRKCTGCGYEETVEQEKKEHTVDSYTTDKAPTCTETGVQSGVCSTCKKKVEKEIPALGHKAGDPIDTEQETCLDRAVGTVSCVRCGEVLSTYGHNFVTTVFSATCTTDGAISKECTRCQIVERTTIAHTGHKEGFLVTIKQATCTQAGEIAIGCLFCDYIFEETKSESAVLAHDYAVTETEEEYLFSCQNCPHSYTEEKEKITMHKITFVSEHGEKLSDTYVQAGEKVGLPLLTADGYTFFGWYTDAECEQIFDKEYLDSDITLYAKWEENEKDLENNNVLSGVSEDFSFIIKTSAGLSAIEDVVFVVDAKNTAVSLQAEDMGDGTYKITPTEYYQKGECYKVILSGDAEFVDYKGQEFWFTVKKANGGNVTVRPGVVKIDSGDIYSITKGKEDAWYIMLYEDVLDVDNFFVIYEGTEDNITHSGKVYEEGTFDKYYVYRIDELTEEEISEVFVDVEVYYDGIAGLGAFVPDEETVKQVEEEFLQSPLFKQIQIASKKFAHLSSDGKYYYDHHYPVVSSDFRRDDSSFTFTFTVDVTFGRLDTATREVKDLFTITFQIKNETSFHVVAHAKNTRSYEFIVTPINTTTVGLYAKQGKKVVSDERLQYFKEIFIKAKEEGETEALENKVATHEQTKPFGNIPLFVVPGVSIDVEVYNVFTFDALGEGGFEVTTKIKPSIGLANYGDGVKVIKNFEYEMSVNAYLRGQLYVSDRVGAKVTISLIGMIHASAGVEVGPYAEAGGMLNVVVEWGTKKPVNFGASAGGYVEVGVEVEAYAELKITTLIFKIKLYQNRWNIYSNTNKLFFVGDYEMPVKFVTEEAPIEKKADLLYPINLWNDISTQVEYQNLKTFETKNKNVSVGLEIIGQPEYAYFDGNNRLVLNKLVGDKTYVDLKIKITYKTLFKIIDLRVYIEHDYLDEFTCHDRTCQYCGYVCKATTPHVYSDWEVVEKGVCSENPYSMRICFDCRHVEFFGIAADEAQHHDYQPLYEQSVEPTCTQDGYIVYRCVRKGCTSETTMTIVKSYGAHKLIWVDDGDTHHQHCQRVGCGYNSEPTDHVADNQATCTEKQVCKHCGHVMQNALGHSLETVASKAPTCTEAGYYTHLQCSTCNEKLEYVQIPALGHSYTVTWTWNGFASAKALAVCANGHSEEHTVTAKNSTPNKPTCIAPGERIHTVKITIDGVEYSDSKTETLLPLGHDFINHKAKEPTCTAVGWYAYESCTRCKHNTKVERAKVPHVGGKATCTARAICDVCGGEYGNKLNHTYVEEYIGDKDGHYYACACGSKGEIFAHVPNRTEPTETESVVCTVCDYVIKSATGHVKHVYTILCSDDTYHWHQCEGCAKIDGKVAHYGGEATHCQERSTCEFCQTTYGANGAHDDRVFFNGKMHWKVCMTCYRKAGEGEHCGGEATCTEKAVCDVCKNGYGDVAEHDMGEKWVCDSLNHYHQCVCGWTEDVEAHIPDRAQPTETQSVKCKVCGYVIKSALGHTNHNYTLLRHNADGHWYKCSGCDLTTEIKPHNGGKTTCTQKAVCAVCHATYGEEPNHTYIYKGNENEHWRECENCDYKGEQESHVGGYNTCVTKAKCDVCAMEYGELAPHTPETDDGDCTTAILCGACKEVLTPAKASHTGGQATCSALAKCDECGKRYGEYAPHDPEEDDGDCTTAVVCSACGQTVIEATNHVGGEATCTQKAKCEVCGMEYGETAPHIPETDDGDCTTDLMCKACGGVAMPGEASHRGGEATCAEYAKCEVCGKEYGDRKAHDPETDDGDCTTAILCKECEEVLTPAKASHTGGQATCSALAKCDECGRSYGQYAPHDPEEDDGDCTTAIICKACGDVMTPAKGHVGGEATCTEYAKCEVCGKEYGSLASHTPETDDGDCTTEVICLACKEVIVAANASHTGGTPTCIAKAKCEICGTEYGGYGSHALNEDDGDCTTAITCKTCKEVLIPGNTSHTGGTATCIARKKCDVCGKTYGQYASHVPNKDDGDCTTAITCSVCGDVTTPAQEGHVGGEATCTQKAKCEVCGMEHGSLAPHTPGRDDGDCTTAIACSVCGQVAVEAKEHIFEKSLKYAYNDVEHWKVCANVGCNVGNKAETQTHSYGEWFLPDHDYSIHVKTCVCGKIMQGKHEPLADDGDCTTEVLCGVCDLTAIGSLTHNFDTDYVHDETNHWHVCANEGCLVEDTAVSHVYGNWVLDENNASMHKHACVDCGYEEWANHDFEGGMYASNDSWHWKKCKDCTAQDVENKQAHDGTQATCTEKSRCKICNNEYGAIDPNNHDYQFSYDDNAHYEECTRCQKRRNSYAHEIDYRVEVGELDENFNYPHTFIEFCTNEKCGYSKILSTGNVHGHEETETYGDEPATCENPGMIAGLRCAQCDHGYFEPKPIPATGHSKLPDGWVEETKSTCTQAGHYAHDVCQWCGVALNADGTKMEQVEKPLANHTLKRTDGSVVEIDAALNYDLSKYPELVAGCVGVPPTDTTAGASYFTCDCCGGTVRASVIGHYYEWKYDDESHWKECAVADCTEKTTAEAHQLSQSECSVCGYKDVAFEYGKLDGIYGLDELPIIIRTYEQLQAYCEKSSNATQLMESFSEVYFENYALVLFTVMRRPSESFEMLDPAMEGDTLVVHYERTKYIHCGYNVEAAVIFSDYYYLKIAQFIVKDCARVNTNEAYFTQQYVHEYDEDSFDAVNHWKQCCCGSIDESTVAAHEYTKKTQEPTCSEYGYTTYTCDCGYGYDDDFKESVEHKYDADNLCIWCKKKNGQLLLAYTLNSDNASYSVTGIGTCTDLDIIIPSTYEDLPVTAIGEKAFYCCSNLTSITIPDSITKIGQYAFYDCRGLKSITLPDGITVIEDYVFSGCYGLTSVNLPDGITSIGDYVFDFCSGLTGVNLPDGVKTIGDYAFYYCSGLTSVTIPGSVTTMGKYIFDGCTHLTSVVICDGVTAIGAWAFAFEPITGGNSSEYYSRLTSVIIPDSVTLIGSCAFEGCTSLAEVYYKGTEDKWNAIDITADDNGVLVNATKYYYSETKPTVEGNFWHYDNDGNIVIWEFYSEGLIYRLNSDNASYAVRGIGTCTDTDIIIPSKYEGLPVTKIVNSAFQACTSLTSITIPYSITWIGNSAFNGCSSLTNITVSENNAKFKSIDGNLYTKDGTVLMQYAAGKTATSFIIPNSVTIIGDYAFYGCSSITSVTIPDGVTSIGDYVFYGCRSITCVTIPDGVTTIGHYAFYGCSKLKDVIIPDIVTTIGDYAFYHCSGMNSVYIGNSVTSIGNSAFRGCTGLTSLVIPDGVTSIGDSAFRKCDSLIIVTIGEGITSIGPKVFSGCDLMSTIVIPKSVTVINETAFDICDSLYEIYYKGTEAEWNAIENDFSIYINLYYYSETKPTTEGNFWHYDNDGNIVIWEFYSKGLAYALNSDNASYSVTGIGTCTDLDIIIPSTYEGLPVTTIGVEAFYNCSNLTSITIPDSITRIGDWAFSGCSGLTSVTIPNSVTSIGYSLFNGCSSLTSVVIGESVEMIGDWVFYNCSSLTNITVSEYNAKYTSIDGNLYTKDETVFMQYAAGKTAENFTIPDSVTTIGNYAFYNCRNLTDVVIGNSVTLIGDYAFEACSSLTSINIPNGVTTIGWRAFEACSSLTSINIPDSVTTIGYYAFSGCSSLTSINISDSVTTISVCAFRDCISLTNIVIPDSVKTIENTAFYNCSGLTSITIGDSVASIGNYAFQACSSLTSVIIPDSVTSIGKQAFTSCSGLTSITIGGGVTSIGDFAFQVCRSLTSVIIPDSVTSIGDYAFAGCSGLTSITIGDSVASIGNYAFRWCTSLTAYYKGTEAEWNTIGLGSYNNELVNATKYYYSETTPTTEGNFWHYDAQGNIAVW